MMKVLATYALLLVALVSFARNDAYSKVNAHAWAHRKAPHSTRTRN